MANTEVVAQIVSMTQDYLVYMMPIIGILAGISFILSFFFATVFGLGRRTFKG